MPIRAVLFDFGGVVTTSPFESFARYEREHGLPVDFIRLLNADNHHENAWARFERNQVSIDEFCAAYEAEAAAKGHVIDARAVLACLSGDIRPEVVEAIRRIKARLRTGCITNNMSAWDDGTGWRSIVPLDELFDVVIESSKVGVRKPDPAIYRMACDALDVAPADVVFLDDLGVNLKPARDMGMATIKVVDAESALAELEALVGFPLRA